MLLMAGLGQALEACGMALPESSRQLSPVGLTLLYSLVGWCVIVLPICLVVLLARWARRSGLRGSWIVISAVVLGLAAGAVQWGFRDQLNLQVASPNDEHPFLLSLPYWMILSSPQAMFKWYASSPQQIVASDDALAGCGVSRLAGEVGSKSRAITASELTRASHASTACLRVVTNRRPAYNPPLEYCHHRSVKEDPTHEHGTQRCVAAETNHNSPFCRKRKFCGWAARSSISRLAHLRRLSSNSTAISFALSA